MFRAMSQILNFRAEADDDLGVVIDSRNIDRFDNAGRRRACIQETDTEHENRPEQVSQLANSALDGQS